MNRILRNRSIMILWISRALSRFGDAIESLALMYLVYELTGSGLAMGTVMLFSGIPNIVIGPIAGVIVDRYNKKAIMFICELVRAVALILIPVFMYFNIISLWHIYILASVASIAESFYEPCYGVASIQVTPKEDLPLLNSLTTTTNSIMRSIGYAVAGVIMVALNKEILFVIDAITFFISAIAALIISLPKVENKNITNPKEILFDLRDAGKYIASNKNITIMLIVIFIINCGVIPLTSFLPIFSDVHLSLGEAWSGYFMTTFSIGTVLGAVIYPMLAKKNLKLRSAYLYGFTIMGIWVLLVCLFNHRYIALAMFLLVGIIGSIIMMWASTDIQKTCDVSYYGRVGALLSTVILASSPIMSSICGWAIDSISIVNVFIITGVVFLLCGLVIYKLFSNSDKSNSYEQNINNVG